MKHTDCEKSSLMLKKKMNQGITMMMVYSDGKDHSLMTSDLFYEDLSLLPS